MMICADDTHPDATVICPYDNEHKICRSRFQRHLVKCEKQFPKGFLEICPYNATHRLPKEKMKEHIMLCPMKRFMEPVLYQNSKCSKDYILDRLRHETTTTIDLIESWSEDESEFPSKGAESIGSIETDVKTTDEKDSDSEDEDDYFVPLRRPYGYSEMMMVETDNVVEDDMISVSSEMGIGMGRGRGQWKSMDKYSLKLIGIGRGKGSSTSTSSKIL